MEIDIVIPCLNSEKTIFQCLNSIVKLNRGIHHPKVYLVDNGCTDQTVSIAKSFENITIITCKEKGRSFARNAGLAAGNGELVAFIDSDVVVDPNWLIELVDLFNFQSIDAVQGKIISAGEKTKLNEYRLKKKKISTNNTFIESETTGMQFPLINTAACIFRRSALVRCNGFDTSLKRSEDTDLSIRLLISGSSFGASLKALSYVYYDGSRYNYLCRAFEVSYLNAEFLISKLGVSPVTIFKDIFLDKLYIDKGQLFFSLIHVGISRLGLLCGLQKEVTDKSLLNSNFLSAKVNLSIPSVHFSGKILFFSPTKRFYISDRSLRIYGLKNKRELIFLNPEWIEIFRKFLNGNLSIDEINAGSSFFKILLDENVLISF